MWKMIGGLLTLPVLLVLLVLMIFLGSEDYTQIIRLNWKLDLPASESCLYETDSGASFGGDGERYHVLAYVDDSGLEEALEREAEPLAPAEEGRDCHPGRPVRPGGPAARLFGLPLVHRLSLRGCTRRPVSAVERRRDPAVCGRIFYVT